MSENNAISFAASIIKKLFIALIVSLLLLFATNLAWLIVFTSYEYETTIVEQDVGDGPANYIGNDGDIENGVSESNEAESTEEKWKVTRYTQQNHF